MCDIHATGQVSYSLFHQLYYVLHRLQPNSEAASVFSLTGKKKALTLQNVHLLLLQFP